MTPPAISLGGRTLDFERPVMMAVLNVTPDSFSDGGELRSVDAAVSRARSAVEAGAQILDVGGESTRPGSEAVDAETETARVLPVIEGLVRLGVLISIDTSKAEVAAAALERGASIVNDVTALRDERMAAVVAEHEAALIVMHMRGEPRTMQTGEIVYDDLFGEVRAELGAAVDRATAAGVLRERLMVDPGIGFGKTLEHNLALTRHLDRFADLGRPIVYGPSRKRFLGALTDRPVEDRDRATAAACTAAVLAGAHVLRVHDVAAVSDAVRVATALREVA